MVDCNFRPIKKPDAAANSSATYQALLRTNNEHGDVVPGDFIVSLRPGYAVEEHSTVVGTDMRNYIGRSFDKRGGDHIVYSCLDVGDKLWMKIRSEEGVESADCNFGPFPMPEYGYEEH